MYVASTEWTILLRNSTSSASYPTYEVIPALLLDLVRILKRLSLESQLTNDPLHVLPQMHRFPSWSQCI